MACKAWSVRPPRTPRWLELVSLASNTPSQRFRQSLEFSFIDPGRRESSFQPSACGHSSGPLWSKPRERFEPPTTSNKAESPARTESDQDDTATGQRIGPWNIPLPQNVSEEEEPVGLDASSERRTSARDRSRRPSDSLLRAPGQRKPSPSDGEIPTQCLAL